MMKNWFKKYNKNDSLIRDSVILFTATIILNFSGFVYHFFMGRLLGPEFYGILGVLLSLLYLLQVFLQVIQTSISRFISQFHVENKIKDIKILAYIGEKKLIYYGIISIIILSILIYPLNKFLNVGYTPLIIILAIFPFLMLTAWNRGILQGLQNFKALGINYITEGLSKLGIGLILVFFGFGITGAVLGITLAMIISFFVSLIPLRKILKKTKESIDTKPIYTYTIPVFLTLTSLTFFYSIDVILVKKFFESLDVGYYSAAAIIGRIIFFATMALSYVMFPKVVGLYEKKLPTKNILFKSLGIVGFVSSIGILGYLLLPDLVINILFGRTYLPISPLIWIFGLGMGFFSLIYTLSFYNLSIKKTRFIWLLISFNVIEVIMLILSKKTILSYTTNLTVMYFVLFIILLIYTLVNKNEKINHNNTCA